MRWLLVGCLAATGCQALFHVGTVGLPGDGGADAGGDGPDTPNLVFVSSMKVVPGSLGTVAAADAMCTSLATAANHPGHYVAWLSSSTSRAYARIPPTARGWVRTDGRPFADTVVDIVQGRIWYPLRLTEKGEDVTVSGLAEDLVVVTGTDADGSTSIDTCNDYTSTTPGVTAGLADNAPYGWTSLMGAGCGDMVRLYCFGTDHNAPVPFTPESTRRAFASMLDMGAGSGLTAFDAECNGEASTNSVPGTFHAALATTTQSALSRFTPGAPWVRQDGLTVIDSSGNLVAPILYRADGYYDITVAWTGAPSLIAKAPSAADSCGEWTLNAAGTYGLTGNVSRSGREAFGGIPNACNNQLRVYCLED